MFKPKPIVPAATALAFLTLSHVAHAQLARPPFDQEPYTHPQRLVTIAPGRVFNLYCTGHGSPTVVFDQGLGGPTTAWANIQPAVSKFTRACSYDRAGFGFSTPGPMPRDTNALVTDLHTLLHTAGIAPPYVLVPHSIAGLNGVLFADRYLSEIAGLVLVDPSFAHQPELFDKIPGMAAFQAQNPDPSTKPCENAARIHILPTDPKLVDLCLDHDKSYSPALTAANDTLSLSPAFWQALESEGKSFNAYRDSRDIDTPELDAAARDFGTLTMIVLTSTDLPKVPGMAPALSAGMFSVWNEGHDRLAARSRNGRNQDVPHAGHYIQFDQPGVVIAAIHEVSTQRK